MPLFCFSQTPWLAMAIMARSQPVTCWTYSTPSSPLEVPILVPRGPTLTFVLYLCPLQLTFVTGEKTTEIFIQSLELGHSATTRAIKASGGHRGNPYRDGQEAESERRGSKGGGGLRGERDYGEVEAGCRSPGFGELEP